LRNAELPDARQLGIMANMKQEILIPIIVASSALGGVIISQAFSLFRSFLDKRHEKQKMLRQKYEEMMFHFSW
jgi:hypothetical protein